MINFAIAVLAAGPLFVLVVLVVEATHTGVFQWNFYREFSRPTDWFLSLPTVFSLIGILVYYYRHAVVSGRPTFGQYVLCYQVVSDEEGPVSRSLSGWVGFSLLALLVWPATVLALIVFGRKVFSRISLIDATTVRLKYVTADHPPPHLGIRDSEKD